MHSSLDYGSSKVLIESASDNESLGESSIYEGLGNNNGIKNALKQKFDELIKIHPSKYKQYFNNLQSKV